jgi:hypothetical protein
MYGSPRNFWDGLDEKAVQRVKGKLTHLNLASRTWLATILDKVTREQTLRMMLEKRRPGHRVREVKQGNLRIFASLDYAVRLFEEGKAFCGFMQLDDPVQYFIGYKSTSSRHSSIMLNVVSVENCSGSFIGGIWYSTVKKLVDDRKNRVVETVEELASTVSRCVLFLPLSRPLFAEKEQDDESWYYHIIDVDHEVLGPTGWELLPIYPVCMEESSSVGDSIPLG